MVNAGRHVRAARSGAWPASPCPVIPFAHQYLVTEAIDGVQPDLPQLRDPDNLVYFRPEVRRPGDGRLRAQPGHLRSLDGIPADFNGKLLPPDWPRFEEISAGAVRRVPAMADAGVTAADQRAGGLHPGQRVHPGRVGGARLLRGGRLLAPTALPGPAVWAGRWRTGSWTASRRSTCGRWTSAASARTTARRPTRWRARSRTTPPTTTSTIPFEERTAGRPLRLSPTYPRLIELDCAFGEKSRLGAPELVRVERGRRRRGALRPRGWAGRHWSPAIGAEALATREAATLFDETSFSKIEIVGPGALAFLRAPLRQPHGPARRPHHLHADAQPARRDRVRLHRHPPGRGSLLDRDRHRLRQPRPGLDPPPRARRRQRGGARPHLRARLPRASGDPPPARSSAA